MSTNYQDITMKVASEYYKEDFNMAILKDARGYFGFVRTEIERLHRDLDIRFKSDLEVLAIYPDINADGFTRVDNAIKDLNAGKCVDLKMLLKSQTE